MKITILKTKKGYVFFAAVILLLAILVTFSACGGSKRSCEEIIEEAVASYGAYGAEADKTVDGLMKELRSADKVTGDKWKKIMSLWKEVENELPLYYDVLPNGLPETDELCIVALGFQLKPDGRMKSELIERLKVVEKSAEKYPNAYIVCTGGGTATENKSATEAGKMAEWLIKRGIDEKRIIVEDQSLTTAQNARYSCQILADNYPQVKQLVIISSDYHIATGALLFGAELTLQAEKAGKEKAAVVSNAAYKAPSGSLSRMFQAGALIELSGNKEAAYQIYYDQYDIHDLPNLK